MTVLMGAPKYGVMYFDHGKLNPMFAGLKGFSDIPSFTSISDHVPSDPKLGQLAPPNAKTVVFASMFFCPAEVSNISAD